MKLKLSTAAWAVSALIAASQAFADCPGPFVADARRAYQQAQAYEKQGKLESALRSYQEAEGSVCENVNPYEADAAKRAAPLGLELGSAAEKKGDLRLAFELYDAGGHFAEADRAFMALTRTKQDDPSAYQAAREHFDTRGLPSFQTNNSAALKVTGVYRPDPKLIAEVAAMPAKGVERAGQRDAAAFNEQYLRDYVQSVQARPEDPTDMAALQRAMSAQQVFAQRWQQQDLMKSSREALQTLRLWGLNSGDPELAKKTEALFAQRADQHAQLLAQKYSTAPHLLEDAVEFITMQSLEPAKADARVAALKAQALKLGDDANAKKHYLLAIDYYDVAGDRAKEQAARDSMSQLAMQKMQPSIDAARKQAEEMQKQFSDPAKVQAMREQAEAARKSLQQQQATSKQANKKSADDLAKELGI